eukprot:GHVH01004806.1.p1 GENE.GHVH01004806.1~~GHVH01004806.1.p1  ORF type:complete len:628 (+),score=102.15 GHVH01004806.1:52-1935(+)
MMSVKLPDFSMITDPEVKSAVNTYLTQEFRPDAIEALANILSSKDENGASDKIEQLRKDFCCRLEFGTAGLRGPMKICGTNAMNVLTVLQTTQGLADYLKTREGSTDLSIVIGYDGRYNSKEFAEYAAAAMLAQGFTVHLFGSSNSKEATVTPTPFTPYYLTKMKCTFGIQVTASHNPKEDNGYKVYDSNGAQIIPPVDADIAAMIIKPENLKKWSTIDQYKTLGVPIGAHDRLKDPFHDVMETYFVDMQEALLQKNPVMCDVKVVYTAMHGVGSKAVRKMMETAKFPSKNYFVVPEQDFPDPEFTTVPFPNPEEKGALDMAMARADAVGAPIVIANDPDADRFAFCEKLPSGQWHRFTGDEIGVLMSSFVFSRMTADRGIPAKKCLLACSAVSSGMMRAVFEKQGATVIDTLTGFKWIMNEGMKRAKEDGLDFIFGYEEALGYACSLLCPDKDGVSAAGIFLQNAMRLYSSGKTLFSVLQDLWNEHGYFVSNNSYVLCHDKVAVNELFKEFRNGGKYMEKVGQFKVTRIRDVTTGYDSAEPDKKCRFPLTPAANMVTLFFDMGRITLRTSGTEPKLKWYAEGCGPDPAATKVELEQLVFDCIEHILKPGKYPLLKVPEEYTKARGN